MVKKRSKGKGYAIGLLSAVVLSLLLVSCQSIPSSEGAERSSASGTAEAEITEAETATPTERPVIPKKPQSTAETTGAPQAPEPPESETTVPTTALPEQTTAPSETEEEPSESGGIGEAVSWDDGVLGENR